MTGLCVLTGHGRGANGEPLDREAEIGQLCLWHRKRLTDVVVAVRELWTDLDLIVEAGSAPKDDAPKTRHLKSPEAPAPANLDVLALRDKRSHSVRIAGTPANPQGDQSDPIPSATAVIASWVLLVAEERPLTADLLPSSTVAQLQLLQRHGDWIAAQDWIDDYWLEMSELKKALSAALRDQPYRHIGRCQLPADGRDGLCGGPLTQENGSVVISCRECGASWTTPQERARLAIGLETA